MTFRQTTLYEYWRFKKPKRIEEWGDIYIRIAGNTADQLNEKKEVIRTIEVDGDTEVVLLAEQEW
jgi:hypothetical protein